MTPPCVIVTGAAGFIGSHLCDELIRKGHSVIGVDNFFRGKPENLQQLESVASFQLEVLDLTAPEASRRLADLVVSHEPGLVLHFAAINGTRYFYDRPLEVLRDNISMTTSVMDGLSQGRFHGKVVYASSSEVYGDPVDIPTPETHIAQLRPGMDRDGYAASKVVGEMLVRMAANSNGWDWVSLRIFNCYGPRMDSSGYGQVIPEFFRKVQSQEPFTIIGDGRHTRSFCFVDDTVRQTLECAGSFINEVVNIGNDTEVEILEVAKTVHDLAGRDFHLTILPARPGDHRRRCPSLTKLKERLGDLQLVSLKEGLATSYQYYSNQPVGETTTPSDPDVNGEQIPSTSMGEG